MVDGGDGIPQPLFGQMSLQMFLDRRARRLRGMHQKIYWRMGIIGHAASLAANCVRFAPLSWGATEGSVRHRPI